MNDLTIDDAIGEWATNYQPTIDRGKHSSRKEIGEALREIRDQKLYRAQFSDFYVYCARRWGIGPGRVDRYIDAPIPITACDPAGKLPSGESEGRYIYFVAGAGLIKIGVADDVKKRFGSIKTMSPVPLALIGIMDGSRRDELALHRKFAQHRRHGEWFLDCESIRSYISERAQMK